MLMVLGLAAVGLARQSPAVLMQPESYTPNTHGLTLGSAVTQDFTASGTVSGVVVLYTNRSDRTTPHRVTCGLLEIESGRTLQTATATVGRSTLSGPLSFAFKPTTLDPKKHYGIRIWADYPRNAFYLMGATRPAFKPGMLYQRKYVVEGALAFRLNGPAVPAGAIREMGRTRVMPMAGAGIVIALLVALLAVGGLVVAAAPSDAPMLPQVLERDEPDQAA
jgi:hypothetical protein